MKMIYIIRHAKSDWSIDGLSDIDRSLNGRGYSDAHNMGRAMKLKGYSPEIMISSPAIRALSTGLIIAEELMFPKSEIRIEPRLYETGVDEYLKVIKQVDEGINSVAIFGHNPIVSDLASHWAGQLIEMPTCAVVRIKFLNHKWSNISRENVEFAEIMTPKMI